jgi:hypothetical protein
MNPGITIASLVTVVAAAVLPCGAAEPAAPVAAPSNRAAPAPPAAAPAAPRVDWRGAAKEQAAAAAKSPQTAEAIGRTKAEDEDADAIEAVDVVGVDEGLPKRGESQRTEGGQVVTWINGNCYYTSPPSPMEPGASTRLWLPQCNPGSSRVIGIGKRAAKPRSEAAEPETAPPVRDDKAPEQGAAAP